MTSVFGAHQNHPVAITNPSQNPQWRFGQCQVVSCYGFNFHLLLTNDIEHHVINLLVIQIFFGVCSSPLLI